jgi:hypothetical protein
MVLGHSGHSVILIGGLAASIKGKVEFSASCCSVHTWTKLINPCGMTLGHNVRRISPPNSDHGLLGAWERNAGAD